MKLFNKVAAIAVGVMLATGVGAGIAVGAGSKDAVPVHAAGGTFQKITSMSDLTSGEKYLIVSEDDNLAFDGSLSTIDAVSNTKSITISSNKIIVASDYYFTITSKTGGYSIKGSGGKYIGSTSADKNELMSNGSDNYTNTITWNSDNSCFVIRGTNSYLVYNNTSGQTRFRFYKPATSNDGVGTGMYHKISLFKETATAQTYTVSFNGNGGTGNMDSVPNVSGNYTLPANGFTAPASKAFSGWKAGNAGDLIPAGGTYNVGANVTFFAQWVDAYTVTYSAGTNGSGSYAHTSQPTGTYTLLPFASLTGVSASSGYRFANYTVGGIDKNPGDTITLNSATSVTVNFEIQPLEATYDFVTNFATYSTAAGSYEGTDWGGYSSRTITAAMVDADYDATISFTNVSKQGNTITDRPVIAAKYNTTSTMLFTLASSVSSSYTITTVDVKFAQWTTKVLNAALYKGTSVSGTALDSFTSSSNPRDLVTSNLNGDSFIVDFVSKDSSGTTNYQLGVTSITIGLTTKAAFGTIDHIAVTSLPNTIYHVGEAYDATGLTVTAYDGVDESTANFKDVTNDVTTGFRSGYVFQDTDVPTTEMFVQYRDEESGTTFAADSIIMHVYSLEEYELVESAPADWSGNYLIVGTDPDDNLGAFNGSLSMLDATSNYKTVTADGNGIVETGQELEWTISAFGDGYSIQAHNGKFIGWSSNSGNGLTASDNALENTLSYSDGAVTIAGSGGRHLTLNSDSTANRFRYYTSGTVQLYKLVESDNADAYAQTFLGAFTCNASGTSQPTFALKEAPSTYWSWALLASEYNNLTSAEKEQFRLGASSESGTNIQKALARYDYVVGKYNKGQGITSYTDFMNRNPAKIGASRVIKTVDSESATAAAMVVVVVSAVSVTAIGGFLLLKKKPF